MRDGDLTIQPIHLGSDHAVAYWRTTNCKMALIRDYVHYIHAAYLDAGVDTAAGTAIRSISDSH